MKKTNLFIKLIAAALVVGLAAVLFAGCGASQEIALVFEMDGKVYTMTEEEFDILLKNRKRTYFVNLLYPSSKDTASFWAEKSTEETSKTNEQYYMELAMEQAKAVLVEKYLFEKYGLTISQDKLDGYQTSLKSDVKDAGGQGAYKQYYGYTAKAYYSVYAPMVDRSDMLFKHLTDTKNGGTGELAATDADLKAYYEEHFVGYQYIVIDTANKVVRDENGNRVIATQKNDKGEEVETEAYKTEKLTDAEKTDKQTLPDEILKKLKDGTSTFEDLIAQYSDDYTSVTYSEGWFLDKEATLVNSTVTSKVKDLKVGEWTGEAVSVGDKKYIVKKIDLKPYVYDEFEKDAEGNIIKDESGNNVKNKYFDIFAEYKDTVNFDKYEKFVEGFFDDVVVKTEITGKYTMADTFLSPYVDDYYRMILYYYYGIQV